MRSLLLILLLAWAPVSDALSQRLDLPRNPLDGRILFESRGCITCHALSGYGGDSGPDLVRDRYFGSFLGLVADIWNHIPEMDRQYRLRKIPRPDFTEREMLDLAGFIFYLRYLGEPGSVSRGRSLLGEKRCTTCHGGGGGPDLTDLRAVDSPVRMVQAMWNHGPAMQEQMADRGVRFPRLTGTDISDLSAYLQMAAGRPPSGRTAPGDPVLGREVFEARRCALCHTTSATGTAPDAPALESMKMDLSVLEVAALMWNHMPSMRQLMAESEISWPLFEGNEMADVIAYLYFLGFVDGPGDAAAGRVVFSSRGCSSCHEAGGGGVGPDLASVRHLERPGRLAQLMWNHADEMEDLMLARNESWPRLSGDDLRNLLEFLVQSTRPR